MIKGLVNYKIEITPESIIKIGHLLKTINKIAVSTYLTWIIRINSGVTAWMNFGESYNIMTIYNGN